MGTALNPGRSLAWAVTRASVNKGAGLSAQRASLPRGRAYKARVRMPVGRHSPYCLEEALRVRVLGGRVRVFGGGHQRCCKGGGSRVCGIRLLLRDI